MFAGIKGIGGMQMVMDSTTWLKLAMSAPPRDD